MTEFYAVLLKYCPFVMGGLVWQPRRYKVQGEGSRIRAFEVFVTKRGRNRVAVHETTTGAYICDGLNRDAALRKARKLIDETPDFRAQIKAKGPHDRHEELTDPAEVARLLAKADEAVQT